MTTEPKSHTIPRVVFRSIATGMLMMAVFTMIWAGIAFGSLAHGVIVLVVFALISLTLIANAIYTFSISKRFRALESEADKAEGKQAGKWFGIIFGAEGVGIFVAVNIATNTGHADLTIPLIALIVGLHFYPLARVFKRTIDYYLATWTTLIAIIAIILILRKTYPVAGVDAFVGIGAAIATSCYGLYMIYESRRLAKKGQPTVSV